VETDELLARVGQMAFAIEEGRRPPELTVVVREALEDLAQAGRLPAGDESRRLILARVARRLDALD